MGLTRHRFDTQYNGSIVRKLTLKVEPDSHCVEVQTEYSEGTELIGESIIILKEELQLLIPVFRDIVKSVGSSGCKCVKVESGAEAVKEDKQLTVIDYLGGGAANEKL
jgi:hypothetical protein